MNKESKVAKICLMAPTFKLAYAAGNLIIKLNLEKEVNVFECNFERAASEAQDLKERGAKVIISRKGTYKRIKQYANVPSVNIETNLSDYIPVLKMLSRQHEKAAFFSYDEDYDDIEALCDIMEIDANFYMFKDFADSERVVFEAIKNGDTFGVGGSTTEYFSNLNGFNHYTVESSEEAILRAIDVARKMLSLQEEEEEKQQKLKIRNERYDLIFDSTNDAIIAVDEHGKVEVMNKMAKQITKLGNIKYEGEYLESIIPNTKLLDVLLTKNKDIGQVMKIKDTMVLTNRVPIIIDNEAKGAVATFTDLKTIQNYEISSRQQLKEHGFSAKFKFSDIITQNIEMQRAKELAKEYTMSDFTIMIDGETGTGKELFAQSIHNESHRKNNPFVAINCSALSEDLLESELFGYEEGAFTGALREGKQGVFELANTGTLFLDEIGDIPLKTQILILRAIETREVRRIGGSKNIPVDIRIVCASNKNLVKEIELGNFREDLYFRLNVLSLMIPPLRERVNDLYLISESILKDLNILYLTDTKINFKYIFEKLKDYPWNGNVRELRNFVERCYVVSQRGTKKEKKEKINQIINLMQDQLSTDMQSNTESICKDAKLIQDALNQTDTIEEAAKKLNISRTTLWRRMKKYNI